MNLTKLFNFNFIKENIKKSIGILLFLFFIIPIVNILYLFNMLNQQIYIINLIDLSKMTYFASFIFPVVVAYILNSYLFKQNSLDFYLSKPINKRKLFFSNIFTGLFIIIVLLIINVIIFSLFNLTNLSIPFSLLFDYFIYTFILYTFIYIVISLAISLCGNFITALIVSIILIWSFPTTLYVDKLLSETYTETYIKFKGDSNEYYMQHIKNIEHPLTLPSGFILKREFNSGDIIKTILLSIIYVFVGYVLFKKRKMENIAVGLKNESLHYTVKTISFLPFALLNALFLKEKTIFTGLIITFAAIIYYLIYDLLTQKKLYKPLKSTIIFTWTYIILSLCFYGIITTYNKKQVINCNELTTTNAYSEYLNTKVTNFDLIKNSLNNHNDTSELFNIVNTPYQIIVPLSSNAFTGIHKDDLTDYIKYLNTANYKDTSAAYYGNYKLNVNKLDLNNIKIDKNNYGIGIKLYIYKNHKYQILTIPGNVNKKTMNYITTFLNENFLSYNDSFREISILDGDNNLTTLLEYVSQKDANGLKNYLEKHYDDEYNNDYIELIYGTQDNYIIPYKYTIKDIEAFEKFLNTYKDLCYNDGKCQKEWCYVNISIDYQSRVPFYEQIVKGVEKLVVLNILKPNEQIPSIRELACTLGINPNTVKKAYDILDSKGIIITKSTKGTFITDDIINAKNDRIKELLDNLNNNILELKNYGFTIEEIIKKIKK